MPWERVDPPLYWPQFGNFVIADRHLPDGTRQHMIPGHVDSGRVFNNFQIIGEADCLMPLTAATRATFFSTHWRRA